ncbi:Metal-dependent phosphohydrolase, HD subdomain protein [Minicystis rosea]|nr:Metal-dependent phosphohydrolase, HD subdomain protein [Minicystis rosea]
MQLVDRHPVIEDALDAWASSLGSARVAYGGHAYRVYNFARRIFGSERRDDALAVASAFHDLGIWSDGTFDYLAPSIGRARDYLQEHASEIPADLVADIIDNHHRLLWIRKGPEADVVEAFRRADLVDVSRGLLRADLDPGFLREAVAAFPYAGFHGVLVRTAFAWFLRHPLRPLPMVRLLAPPTSNGGIQRA